MTATRKQGQDQGRTWIQGLLDVLKGGVLALGVSLLVLGVAACLIRGGVLPFGQGNGAGMAACILGGFVGGLYAVKCRCSAPLPTGLGVGVALFLFLLTFGVLFFHAVPAIQTGGTEAGACLCGGGLAGVLGRGGDKKRRKR